MPLVPLAAALALGIFLASVAWDVAGTGCDVPALLFLHAHPTVARGLSLLPLAFLGLAYLWREHRARFRGLMILYLGLGALLYLARPFSPCFPAHHVASLAAALDEGGTVVLTGVIDDWPDVRSRSARYRLRVEEVRWQGERRPMRGAVLVRAPRYPVYRYGDRVRVVGRLSRPPVFEGFDYRRYLARQGIHAVVRAERIVPLDAGHGSPFWAALYRLRARAAAVIDATLPEPYAALTDGILLGIESGIPRRLYADFNATGTSHIIVISGFNIAIVAGLFLAFLTPLLGRRRAAVVAILGIGLYVLFVGADAAVVRAGIMGGIFAASRVLRRQTHALNSLFASALLMLALNPLTLWDVGFQLSFLATLGLVTVLPPLQGVFRRALARLFPRQVEKPAFDLLNEAVVVTLAAQLTTTPLIMATFGRVSLISLLANALILPVQPLVMMGAGVSTMAGMGWLPLGRVLALIPLLPLAWTVAVVRMTARWPGAGISVAPGVSALVMVYYAGLAVYVYTRYRALLGEPARPSWWTRLSSWGVWRRVRAAWMHAQPRRRWLVPLLALMPTLPFFLVEGSVTLSVLPGGHTIVQQMDVPPVVVPARGPRVQSALSSLRDLAEDARVPAIWVLTHSEPETLAAFTLVWRQTRPALVILPPLCVDRWPCPAEMGAFLHNMAKADIPRLAAGPNQALRVGMWEIMYLLPPRDGQTVHPVLVRAKGVDVLLPPDIPVTEQARLGEQVAYWRRQVPLIWVLPFPRSGTWPDARALAEMRPSLLLYPLGVTYPPTSARGVSQFPRGLFDPDVGLRARLSPKGQLISLTMNR